MPTIVRAAQQASRLANLAKTAKVAGNAARLAGMAGAAAEVSELGSAQEVQSAVQLNSDLTATHEALAATKGQLETAKLTLDSNLTLEQAQAVVPGLDAADLE